MSDVNKSLGASGAGQIVAVDGVDWTILPPNDACLAKFQAYLESCARRKLVESKGDWDAETYEDALDRTLKQINSGVYSWGKPEASAALRTIDGGLRFLSILMRQAHPKLTDIDVKALVEKKPDEFKLALQSLLEETVPNGRVPKEGGP